MGYKCIHRSEINPKKWEDCALKSSKYLLYNQLWYLDIVCNKNWNALVWDDYRVVFPLPISGKFGLHFLQNPNLVQQLDFLGKSSEQDIIELKNYINTTYKFIALSTRVSYYEDSIPRCNLRLDTNTYVSSKPSSTLRNNLKKAEKHKLKLMNSSSLDEGLTFLKTHFHLTGVTPSEAEWAFYEQVMKRTWDLGKAKFQFVFKDDNPVQFAFWIVDDTTAYYLLNISNEAGRGCGASHFAIDAFIKTQPNITCVDFEGSSIEGVKRFYKSFGAQEETYYLHKENRLPFFLKWFKN